MSRFVLPESDRLPLSNGDWILVRRRLNTGQQRAHLHRCTAVDDDDGVRRIDSLDHGLSTVVAYLLDWSLTDAAGPIPLRDETGRPFDPTALAALVDNLDPDDFTEIKAAIEAHRDKQTADRADAKKKAGRPTSSPTASSPDTSTGASTSSPG